MSCDFSKDITMPRLVGVKHRGASGMEKADV